MIRKKYYTGEQIIEVLHEFCNDYDEVLGMLNRFACLETADVEPVRHGEWIPESPHVALAEECSNCGGIVYWDDNGYLHDYPFCPFCGAKMYKEET